MRLLWWLWKARTRPTLCPVCVGPILPCGVRKGFCPRCWALVSWTHVSLASAGCPESPADWDDQADEDGPPDRTPASGARTDGPVDGPPAWIAHYVACPDPTDTGRCFNCGESVCRSGPSWQHQTGAVFCP